MTNGEDEGASLGAVSLCVLCAKHREIKELVESDLVRGLCGVCGVSETEVFNTDRFAELRNLIRALVRFHFSEDDYNSHWGGTSLYDILLVQKNSLIAVAKSDEYVDDFMYRLEEEGGFYPEHNEGICLYAGHDEISGRLLQFSIPKTACRHLNDIDRRLGRENFHRLEADMETLMSRIVTELDLKVEKGSLWFRSRTGVKEQSTHFGFREVTRIAEPFKGKEISALPPPSANPGRMNRQGVSVLYLADEIETAIAEIRPHPGHLISVGGFRALRDLRIANFDIPISRFAMSDARLDTFAIIYHIDALLGSPVTPDERHKYALTQLLADTLIRQGFDGVSFRSSVGAGRNLCVFDPDVFEFDSASSQVRQVVCLKYTFSQVPMSARAEFED